MLSNILIAEADAIPLVGFLIDFLGPGGIERKFDQLTRALQHASLLLKKYWIRPQGQLWLVETQLADGLESLIQGLTFTNPRFRGSFPADVR